MKKSDQLGILAVSLLCLTNGNVLAQFAADRLQNERLNYRLVAGGKQIGVANVSIHREVQNEIPLVRIVQVISGAFNQTTEVLLCADSSLQAISSYTSVTQANQIHVIRLNYKPERVSGRMELPAALGGDRRIDEIIAAGTVDFNAAEFALRASDLGMGGTIAFPLYNPQQGGRQVCRASVTRREEITVPAGTFRCRRVEATAGQSRQVFFFDDQFPHRLILQKLPAIGMDIELLPE